MRFLSTFLLRTGPALASLVLSLWADAAYGQDVSADGEIAISSGGSVDLGEGLNILSGGTVTLAAGDSELRLAGTLTIAPGGTLTSAGVSGAVFVGGHWSNSGTFTPGLSTVTFNGTGWQSINGGPAQTFYNLTDTNPTLVMLGTDVVVEKVCTLSGGRLRVGNGRKLTLGSDAAADAHTVASGATLDLDHSGTGTATLEVGTGDTLSVGGTLEMKRESAAVGDTSQAAVGVFGSGPATISIASGGQMWARHFRAIGAGSFVVQDNGGLVDFSEGNPVAWKLDLSQVSGAGAARIPRSLSAVSFLGSTSVKSGPGMSPISLLGGAGASAEDDLYAKVSWVTGAFTRVGDGTTYDTLAAALIANPTASATFRASQGAMLNDSLDLNAFTLPPGGHILENAILAPMQPVSGARLALTDGSQRLKLRNALVASGGLQQVIVENGTLYPAGPSGLTLTAVAQKNVIRKGTTTAMVDATNRILEVSVADADASYFGDRASYDFHLQPGATQAIDAGMTIAGWTSPRDMEGDPRPLGAAWDIGMDERDPIPPDPVGFLEVLPLNVSLKGEWTASPSSDVSKYRVRWKQMGSASWGPSVAVTVLTHTTPSDLANGTSYDFGVKAVDPAGNESTEVVGSATPSEPFTISGSLAGYGSIQAAIDAATPGQTVLVGAGAFSGASLSTNGALTLGPGVSLKGYSAHHTKIQGTHASAETITVLGSFAAGGPVSEISHLSLTSLFGGGGIRAQIADVYVHHVVIHSIVGTKPAIGADSGGKIQVVNVTIMSNTGWGILSATQAGNTIVKNSIVGKNGGGILVTAGSEVHHNTSFQNSPGADYGPGVAGTANDGLGATFLNEAGKDFREAVGSLSVDKADPADSYSNEPAWNGNRRNRGAYGDTPYAAVSPIVAPSPIDTGSGGDAGSGGGSCAGSVVGYTHPSLLWLWALLSLAGSIFAFRLRRAGRLRGTFQDRG